MSLGAALHAHLDEHGHVADLERVFVQDEGAMAKLTDSVRSNFNERYEDFKKWGGGIMGAKSQERTRQKEKAHARELAKRQVI